MSKNITIIPPSEGRSDTLRVAAYCRVSTALEEQESSYASQIRSYTELISQHEGWELVDIYADEAASGTKTDKREDFNRLLADCRKGKIDRVLVKSISRFSRNTKDCLAALRELMRLGVTVQFEKENIDTGTLTTELMVSVSGSLAQQESMSISQNIRMGYRRRMERGEFIASSPPYGYRNAGGGRLEIVPEEAEVIRWVFESYLNGQGIVAIAEEMNRRGVPKKHGEAAWIPYAVACWLRNEKYTGNTLCQKTFTTGFPYISVKNRGEVDQFYIENSHPAIISQEIFDKVQALRKKKKAPASAPSKFPLTRKMICGKCGATFYRTVDRHGANNWVCSGHKDGNRNGKGACPNLSVRERDIYTAFIRMYNKLRLHEGIILRPALDQMEALESAVQRENPAMLEVNRAIAQATEQNYKISKLRASGLLDADACAAKLATLDAQLTQLRAKRRRLLRNDDISEMADALRQTVETLHQGPEQMDEFDEELFNEMVEKIAVDIDHVLRFRLRGGFDVAEPLWRESR
ncbi:recombinase family protein [Clostridiaceae bacterium]|nr:recombinase family protein [Clostridiaceae bacterium]